MEIWKQCKVTNKRFNTMRGFLNHLRTLKMTSKEYYDKFYKSPNEGICYCGKETTYKSFSYRDYCSDVCACKSDAHRLSVKNRFINNPEALDSFKHHRNTKKWSNNVEKRKKTIQQKCVNMGITETEYYSNHSKTAYLSRSEETKKNALMKMMETKNRLGNYGGRSGYKPYPFFDTIVTLQGYEPIALESLINDYHLGKNDIKIGKSEVPTVGYFHNNKKRIYFPDFYLHNQNLLIEVKSEYTLKQHYDVVMKKCQASIDSGYSICLLVISKHEARNRKLDSSKKLLDWAISSQAPNPIWYGEGSTTILNGVGSSDPKCNLSL